MAGIKLYEWQTKALHHMHNGCVLCGVLLLDFAALRRCVYKI